MVIFEQFSREFDFEKVGLGVQIDGLVHHPELEGLLSSAREKFGAMEGIALCELDR